MLSPLSYVGCPRPRPRDEWVKSPSPERMISHILQTMMKDADLVTHEPMPLLDWPTGHVRVELTEPDDHECIRLWVHGHTHFLHSTTARELAKMLEKRLSEYNKTAKKIGLPGV